MKLSEYKNEQAIEILADIIEPATAILNDDEIKTVYNREGSKIFDVAKAIMKRHAKEIVEILARLDGCEPPEYECTVFTLPAKIIELMNDKELISFFSSQSQMRDGVSSGSAMENTEEADKA